MHGARLIVHPKGQRRTPNPVPGDRPIPSPVQPLAEAPLLNMIGHPAHLAVGRQEPILKLLHLDVPARHGAVNQRRFRAVAEGVAVDDDVLLVERARLLQVTNDLPIGVLHVLPCEIRNLRIKPTIEPYGHGEGAQARSAEGVVVIFSKGRRLVYEARAVIGGDVIAGDNREGTDVALVLKIGKGRRVASPGQGCAGHHLKDLKVVAFGVGGHPRLGEVEGDVPFRITHLRVGKLRVYAHR